MTCYKNLGVKENIRLPPSIFSGQQVLVLSSIHKHKKRILANLTPHLDLTHFVYAKKYSAES